MMHEIHAKLRDHKLYLLCNDDLQCILTHLDQFTDEELLNIPNIFVRGECEYLEKISREVMIGIKVACYVGRIQLRLILPIVLSEAFVFCHEKNKTGDLLCGRERVHGCLACSCHKERRIFISDFVSSISNK
jgi:hypothetical protein